MIAYDKFLLELTKKLDMAAPDAVFPVLASPDMGREIAVRK
jgi:hypothetical protein